MDEGVRSVWREEPDARRRVPDSVRVATVRALLITSLTLTQAIVAFLFTVSGSWWAFPLVLSTVASVVVTTWSVLDVWITRQVWAQRGGVRSQPSSSARPLRRERRGGGYPARDAEETGAPRRRAAA